MTDKENPAASLVTGNFQLNANMPNGKTFSVSGYLYDGESVESVNQRVDRFHDILDRQRTRAEIPELEAKRDHLAKQLQNMRDVIADLHNKKQAGKSLTSQEKQTLGNLETSIGRMVEDIDKGTAAIAEAKAKVGMA